MSHTLDHLLLAMQQDQQSPEIFSSLLSSWIEHTATELGEVISRHGATDQMAVVRIESDIAIRSGDYS